MENRLTARLATRHWATLVALAAILVITLLWWGLALWPLPADAPPWIARARCDHHRDAEQRHGAQTKAPHTRPGHAPETLP